MRRGALYVEDPLDCSELATLGDIHWEAGSFKVQHSLLLTLNACPTLLALPNPLVSYPPHWRSLPTNDACCSLATKFAAWWQPEATQSFVFLPFCLSICLASD